MTDISCLSDKYLCYLSDKLFMPFELNDREHSSALCDIEPDLHFYKEFNQVTVKCNYYLDTKFNEEITEPKGSTDVLSEVQEKILVLWNYMNILKHESIVIALTETWLNDNDFDLYGLSGCKIIGRHGFNRTGGGVAVCTRDHSQCMFGITVLINHHDVLLITMAESCTQTKWHLLMNK